MPFQNQAGDTMARSSADAGHDIGVRFAPKEVHVEHRSDGVVLLRSPLPLTGCVDNIVDYLQNWAEVAPDRIFLAQRAAAGGWEVLHYGEAWRRVQAVAQALLDLGLNADRPIAILSGASIEHAVLTLAGMLVGRPSLARVAELHLAACCLAPACGGGRPAASRPGLRAGGHPVRRGSPRCRHSWLRAG